MLIPPGVLRKTGVANEQGEDRDHEVFPLILEVREVLRANGVPLRPRSAACGPASIDGHASVPGHDPAGPGTPAGAGPSAEQPGG